MGKRRSAPRKRTTHKALPQGKRRTRRRGASRRGGGTRSLVPDKHELERIAASAGVGWVETKAKGDPNFIVNKLPAPIDALGFTGNLALVLWLGSKFVLKGKGKLGHYVDVAARSAANIAAYQISRRGAAFAKGTEVFSVAGWDDDDVARAIEANSIGALDAAPEGDDTWAGLAYAADEV